MKKAIALLLALVTLLSLTACAGKEDAASSALDQIKQKGELVVGTSVDYPPYEFHTEVDGKDTIVGFDMEIAQAIADKLGVSLKIVDMSFDNLLMSLANDEFNLVIAGLTADEEWRKTTDFSDPYLESKNLILVRAEDADKYASLDDLKGAKGGAQTGSKPYNNCVTYCGEETTVGLAKVQDLVMELEAGKLDVVFLDYMTVLSYADAKEDLAAVDLGILRPVTATHRRQEGEHGAGRVHQRRSGGAEGAERHRAVHCGGQEAGKRGGVTPESTIQT